MGHDVTGDGEVADLARARRLFVPAEATGEHVLIGPVEDRHRPRAAEGRHPHDPHGPAGDPGHRPVGAYVTAGRRGRGPGRARGPGRRPLLLQLRGRPAVRLLGDDGRADVLVAEPAEHRDPHHEQDDADDEAHRRTSRRGCTAGGSGTHGPILVVSGPRPKSAGRTECPR
ncbi:hypothetical protein SDC9_135522 [bioreactor metagenome]|uniref:Uncharacterized protein n=1 Tax=bioreactor metagenome TaxID=1076179 RepID=A0A645DHA9_9ZZZZ